MTARKPHDQTADVRLYTLFEEVEEAPTMAALDAGTWNGFSVPRATAQAVIDYWSVCQSVDKDGEWATPFVTAEGLLRIPSANDADNRSEDYVYSPVAYTSEGVALFDVDGLVWSEVTA